MTGPPAKIDVIGAPIDLGVHELGLKLGPDAFRQARLLDILADQGFDVADRGNIALPQANGRHLSPAERLDRTVAFCRTLADRVGDSIARGRLPVCLGGDHSLAIGSIAGAARQVGRLGCLWLDAHPDANTPDSSPSGNIHGMPAAVALGYGHPQLVGLGRPGGWIDPPHLAMVGLSDIDPGERALLERLDVAAFSLDDIIEQGLAAVMDQALARAGDGTDGVHVSFDLDVLHSDVAPGVGIPSDVGLTLREAMYLCRRIARRCPVCSIDLVSLNPVRDRDMATAHRAIELLLALLGCNFTFRYAEYFQQQQDGLRY